VNAIHVLSVLNFTEEQLQKLRSVSPYLMVNQRQCHSPEEIAAALDASTEALCTFRLPDDLSIAPSLRWVQVASAGVNHLLDHPIMESDILLTNASGIHATSIGEWVLAMMLNLTKRWPWKLALKSGHGWPQDREFITSGDELWGKVVGIVGYGSIGREVARLCQGLGMRVLAAKRDPRDRWDRGYCLPGRGDPEGRIPEALYGPDGLTEMLSQCDYVVIAAPLTRETQGLIGAEELAAMKPSAYLINIARGGLVDEEALVEALRCRRIAGAALDVFTEEPLPSTHPLWELPNVLLTPHISGAAPSYNDRLSDLFAENLRRYVAGESLLNLVDKKRQY